MLKVKHYLDDPHLKNAMKRLLCSHEAPADLRERVGKMVCPVYAAQCGRTIALCITAGVAVLASVASWASWPTATPGEAFLPQTIAESLIRTHDACARDVNHHLIPGVAAYDLPAVGANLAGQLRVPVLAASLPDWNFVGAGPCPVWGHKSGHLLYRNGVERLSVFTLPSADFAPGETGQFEMTLNDHHLAGFLRNGALYCVVVDSPDDSIKEPQVERLRDRLRDDFSPAVAESSESMPVRRALVFDRAPSRMELEFSSLPISLFPTRLIAYHSNP